MKKRIVLTLLALCLCLALLPVTAFAASVVDSGTCGDNLTWKLEGNTLTISGTGAIEDYPSDGSGKNAPWDSVSDSIQTVVLEDGVTSIGERAFDHCSSLTVVTIPGSVLSIGNKAFYYCTSLSRVTIPGSVTSIESFAFSTYTSLAVLFEGDMPGSIGNAFNHVTAKVYYPEENTTYTTENKLSYGGSLTWIPWSDGEITGDPAPATVVQGQTAQFDVAASGGWLRYQWQVQMPSSEEWTSVALPGADTATLSVPATADMNGCQYRCAVTDCPGNTVYSKPAALAVTPPVEITDQPGDAVTVSGWTAQFRVSAAGLGLNYQWQQLDPKVGEWADIDYNGYDSATLLVPAAMDLNGCQYRCIVTDSSLPDNRACSDAATLTVRPQVEISSQPADVAVVSGKTAQFSVSVTGADLTYQWMVMLPGSGEWVNIDVPGANTATLSLPATVDMDGAQYHCIVTDSAFAQNQVYSDVAVLTVKPPVEITAQPADTTVVAGQRAQFIVNVEGWGLSYQWQQRDPSTGDWTDIFCEGFDTNLLIVDATPELDGFQYRCVVTDCDVLENQICSDAATLTIGQPVIITGNPTDLTVVAGQTAQFSVTAEGTGIISYQWIVLQSGVDGEFPADFPGADTATLSVPTTEDMSGFAFYCMVTDVAGNVAYSNVANLTVQPPMKITSQPADVTIAYGMTAEFSVTAEGWNPAYQWQKWDPEVSDWTDIFYDGYNSPTLSILATKDLDGCQFRCRVENSELTENVTYSEAATLTVKLSTLKITGHPGTKTVEAGKNAQFGVIASGTGLTYQWQYRFGSGAWTNTTLSGNKTSLLTVPATAARNGCQYRCVVKDSAGNVAYSNPATLTVKAPTLKITGHPGTKTVEAGKNAQFGVIASGTGLTYQWQYRFGSGAWTNTTLSGNKTSLLTVPATAARNGCQYRCVVKDTYGQTVYSNAATLTVKTPALKITGHPGTKTVEAGKNAQFGVVASGTNLTYQWQYRFGTGAWTNTTLSGNKTSLLTVPATAARNGCQYRCVVKDSYGQTVYSNPATLTVKLPALKITGHPGTKTVDVGKNAQFGVVASGTGLTYQWQYRFGSGAWTNTTLSGNKTSLLTVPATAARNGCQYRCVVKDSAGNVAYSNPATLTVK